MTVIVALVLMLPVVIALFKPMYVVIHRIDPDLLIEVSNKGKAIAYITVKGTVKVPEPLRIWRFGDITIYKVYIDAETLDRLKSMKNVVSIYGAKKFSHAPLYSLDPDEYPFRDVDIDNKFHRVGRWIGRGVTVAIIDTGIDYTHPDFYDENNRTVIKVLVSMFYVNPSGQYIFWEPYKNGTMEDLLNFDMDLWRQYGEPAFLDINGHGTHVAGIIAGRGWASSGKYLGVAPATELVIIKAFNKDGEASIDTCLEALEWVYNNTEKYDIKVLSLSWGASFASDGRDPVSLSVNAIAGKGVLVFAAAGNEGNLPTTVVVPAVAERAFAVGAWDAYYDRLAPFSSLGPTIDMRMKPDLVAAGVMVVSCKSQFVDFPDEYEVGEYYVALSGTSMSTPVAAGIAADFIEYFRYWYGRDPTINEFIKWVEENSRHINMFKDFITGVGIPIAPR